MQCHVHQNLLVADGTAKKVDWPQASADGESKGGQTANARTYHLHGTNLAPFLHMKCGLVVVREPCGMSELAADQYFERHVGSLKCPMEANKRPILAQVDLQSQKL